MMQSAPILSWMLSSELKKLLSHPIGGHFAIPVSDSLKKIKSDTFETMERDQYLLSQTPQIYRFEPLYKALTVAHTQSITYHDETAALIAQGHQTVRLEGSPSNIKITYPEQLAMAQQLL